MSETLDRLNAVFREVFGAPQMDVDRETTADDVPGWDSLAHVTLIVTVEQEFGVRFRSHEVALLQDVGELERLIDERRT